MNKARCDQFNVKFKNDVNKRLDSVSDAADLVKSEVSWKADVSGHVIVCYSMSHVLLLYAFVFIASFSCLSPRRVGEDS